jgi:hypothetical protein
MAEAIMLPITKEVLVQMPIFFGEAIVQATKSALQIQISVTCSLLNLTDIILWWKNRLYHCLIITNNYEENAYFPQEKGRPITPTDRDSVCD